jgi:solute carrier family 38 (sodium-coupled neutral amino acid transporter), member 11
MAFAFMCHHNTFLVYQSMRNASLERWERVTHISVGFAWGIAALFGISGYATFRALSQGELKENLLIFQIVRTVWSASILK